MAAIAQKSFLLSILLLCQFSLLRAQQLSNYREKTIAVADTMLLDSLSIIPGSVIIEDMSSARIIPNGTYILDEARARLVWLQKPVSDSVRAAYRVFPFNFTKPYAHKNLTPTLAEDSDYLISPYVYAPTEGGEVFDFGTLDYNGSFSRGLSFGNNQDVTLNSSFNLQLSGFIAGDVEVLASITDNNIPIQPDGNTQQIQEFDKVFIKLMKDNHALTVGDFEIGDKRSYFMQFFKKLQGGSYSGVYTIPNGAAVEAGASLALSKGKFARNELPVVEGNQGPYKLTGANGESFIIVLAGSEKVYIDGELVQRGAENDYVIDYNLGEITFTPNVLITKDLRIQVEFEYSDKNYFRSLVHGHSSYQTDKLRLDINLFSEQDSKNQPVNQELDSLERAVMQAVGDDIDDAFVLGIDTIEYDVGRVMYRAIDTLYNNTLYRVFDYSTNPDSAFFVLTFVFTGEGEGSYSPAQSTANGRVFQWVGPGRGSYEPIRKLITPKKQQMASLAGEYRIDKRTLLKSEVAVSSYDANTFSGKDDGNDEGLAQITGLQRRFILKGEEGDELSLLADASYEYVDKRFVPIERFRPTEFQRDWNLINEDTTVNEHMLAGGLNLVRPSVGNIAYEFSTFLRGEGYYKGFRHLTHGSVDRKGFRALFRASYLESDNPVRQTQFLRPKADVSKGFAFAKGWRLGVRGEQEHNRITEMGSDTLSPLSFLYNQFSVYITTPDTSFNRILADYTRRYDYTPEGNGFKISTVGDIYNFNGELISNPRNQLKWNLTYRHLLRKDSIQGQDIKEDHYLGRVEYGLTILKGFARTNILYELGSGREQRRDFVYIEDPDGKGVYLYRGDLNENGVQDINEFELAPPGFEDEARYVRVSVPTNEYVPVNSTQFNTLLNIDPRARWFSKRGILKAIARFSTQTSLQIGRKVLSDADASPFNPFALDVQDTFLVSTNTTVRNSVFFNRTDTRYGVEYTWQDSRNKFIVTNGYEARALKQQSFRVRWNITPVINTNLAYEFGNKINDSQFFEEQDYDIRFNEIEPKLTLIFSTKFRLTGLYNYSYKENIIGEQNDFSVQNKFTTEFRFNVINQSTLNAQVSYASVAYTGNPASSVGFAILQGLQNGNNYLWSVSYDRKLSDVVALTLIYDGRKTGEADMVHIGRMQITALF